MDKSIEIIRLREINYILAEINNYIGFLLRATEKENISESLREGFRIGYNNYVKDLKDRMNLIYS